MTSRSDNKPAQPESADSWILYDGECPFCSNYVRLMRLRDTIGPVRLVNARDGGPEVERAVAAGYDLDEGMIFYSNGQYHHGGDAMHMMALLSGSSRFVNRLNNLVFRSGRRSVALYPFLRGGRNLALRMLGRKKISGQKF